MPRTLYQDSKFTSKNETESSEAWTGILAGHGIVSIPPEYAAQKHLPPTSPLPDGNGNLAYVIEAYHTMHCVVSTASQAAILPSRNSHRRKTPSKKCTTHSHTPDPHPRTLHVPQKRSPP